MKHSEYFIKKRNEIGLSQSKLADLLGFSSQAISAWENGRSYPDLSIWAKYASILKVDLTSFLECKDDKNNNNCDELMFDASKFANNIKYLRKKYKYTQTQLANSLNVNTKTIGGWEQGISFPSLTNFVSLCSIFKLYYDELYFAIEKIEKPAKVHSNKKILIPLISALLVLGIAGGTVGIVLANNKKSSGDHSSFSTSESSVEQSSDVSESISTSILESSSESISESSIEDSSFESSSLESSSSSEEISSIDSNSSSEESSIEILDYEYIVDGDDTLTITAIPDDADEIIFPTSIDGHNVKEIQATAVTNSKAYVDQTLKKLIFPDNVSMNGFNSISFKQYSLLEEINVPNNETLMGDEQFRDCVSLKSFTIPSQIEGISEYLFSGCSNMSEAHIECSINTITFCMFRFCHKLTSVNIPNTVSKIDAWAFQECRLLPEITLPTSLKRIEERAFLDCESLKTIVIPSGVTTIEKEAFKHCASLESIYIPSSVVYIGENAFRGCDNLTILCEASSQPDTWNVNWNSSNCDVVWEY